MKRLIRLVQIDGKLPNLALMKLSHWHQAQGDEIEFTRRTDRGLFDRDPDVAYASAIFSASKPKLERFRQEWPQAVIGGTGSDNTKTVEQIIGGDYERYDYGIYPDYEFSLGFSQRGCRLKCGFCVVPAKEGRPRAVNTIADIHRPGSPKKIVLLDNDFFGQPRTECQARAKELRDGGYKVSFNQGLNIRLIHEEGARCLSTLKYYDDQFKKRRLYTAWDNLRDENIFFKGVRTLEKAGIPPRHLMVYMLIGYDPEETWERIFHRFRKMTELGILPYPMVYNNARKDLKRFQRWVVTGLYNWLPWEEYTAERVWKPKKSAQDESLFKHDPEEKSPSPNEPHCSDCDDIQDPASIREDT